MAGALEGVKVVELAIWAAAPGGGVILADWGAEVIKIEDPNGGDPFRGFLSTGVGAATSLSINGAFESDNRNKKSIAVDIRTEEGRQIVYRLVEQADVFLTNFRPAAVERYKMDYATLHARNPRLIYVGLTGYGKYG
jgi:crotonobetainyl-CoA:carnitine CoA-transferase CaiB-like acyl-CoA transferase